MPRTMHPPKDGGTTSGTRRTSRPCTSPSFRAEARYTRASRAGTAISYSECNAVHTRVSSERGGRDRCRDTVDILGSRARRKMRTQWREKTMIMREGLTALSSHDRSHLSTRPCRIATLRTWRSHCRRRGWCWGPGTRRRWARCGRQGHTSGEDPRWQWL